MFNFKVGVNDELILMNDFVTFQDAADFIEALRLDPSLAEELDEDCDIWKLDIEVQDEEGNTLGVETIWEEDLTDA